MRNAKAWWLGLVIAVALLAWRERGADAPHLPTPEQAGAPATRAPDDSLRRAIDARAQDVPVEGRGVVVKLLPDDREGSPHQRILLRVDGGGTVLVAHNLDLAPRVAPLAAGDGVEFAGEYVWNEKGGVVHWTHPDPRGSHRAGWIRRVP
jgi:hypothetical protein